MHTTREEDSADSLGLAGGSPAGRATSRPARSRSLPLVISSTLYLRLAAAAGIVWSHTPGAPLQILTGPWLAVFLYLSFTQAAQRQSLGAVARRRAHRLLIPWAAWWFIYAAAEIWMARGPGAALGKIDGVFGALAWPSIHLWYLPFVFVMTLLVQAARAAMTPLPAAAKPAVALAGSLLLLMLQPLFGPLPAVANQWWGALPAVGLGVCYAAALGRDGSGRLRALLGILACVCVAVVPTALAGDMTKAVAYAGGSALMLLCAVPLPRHRLVAHAAALTLGIYLAHPLVMLAVWKVLGTQLSPMIVAPLAFFGAGLLAWVLRRLGPLRKIV